MSQREKRRLQILTNPITKRMDEVEERLDDLSKQEPVEPDPRTHSQTLRQTLYLTASYEVSRL